MESGRIQTKAADVIGPGRFLSDEALLVHIKAVHRQNRGGYGRPRIWRELRNDGVRADSMTVVNALIISARRMPLGDFAPSSP